MPVFLRRLQQKLIKTELSSVPSAYCFGPLLPPLPYSVYTSCCVRIKRSAKKFPRQSKNTHTRQTLINFGSANVTEQNKKQNNAIFYPIYVFVVLCFTTATGTAAAAATAAAASEYDDANEDDDDGGSVILFVFSSRNRQSSSHKNGEWWQQ